ncbi:13258_t:CDS:1, partial [Cetraspora pellucida]
SNIFPARHDIIYSHWYSSYSGGAQYRRHRQVTCRTLCQISVMQEALRLGVESENYDLLRCTTHILWRTANKDEKLSYVNLRNQLNPFR